MVLIGPGASGKSTWAEAHFRPNEIVSSDRLRAMVGIDEGDRRAGTAAFDLLERIVAERLGRRLTTVVDTLGFDRERRRSWIVAAHQAGLPAYAVVFDTSPEVCRERNAARERSIPKTVLDRQLRWFRSVKSELGDDGYDAVLTEQPVAVVTPAVAAAPLQEGAAPRARLTFGLLLSRFDWPGERDNRPAQLASIAERAEKAGFEDLWVMDHFRQIPRVGRPWEEMPESYTTLSYLAGVTERIRLGVLVSGVTYRNPVHLGKIIATLDVLSGGRANCGLGLAWHEEEHRAYGWGFPPTSERYALLEDTLRILPLLWGQGSPGFEGKVVRAAELMCYPRPIQGRIPILVGGSGEKRTLRLVARYADACNLFGSPDRVRERIGVLHRHCEEVDRDPSEILVTSLTGALAVRDRQALRARIDALRPRDTPPEAYAARHNAGTVPDVIGLFAAYAAAGVQHPIVVLPDVALEGSVETFAEVIAAFS